MKYTSFKSDIIGIIHSSDNDYVLKFYDTDGNVTIDEKSALWVYIDKPNIMIQFPDEDASMTVWSSSASLPDDFETIMQRFRHQSVVNGISLNNKLFDNLDRRKIYNIIKKSIILKKDEEMNESFKNLSKTLCEVSQMIRNTKKSSDFYISESMHSQNISALTESYKHVVMGINKLNTKPVNKLLDLIVLESSSSKISNIIKQFMVKFPKDYNNLCENINNLRNATSFVQSRFRNNIMSKKLSNVQMISENVVVYTSKTKSDNENLIKAYNHLVSVSEGVTRGIDLLRVIKKHNLCETYRVSKEMLLDFWLSKEIKEVSPQTLLVFENTNGEYTTVSEDMKTSLKLLTECINCGDGSDSILFNAIIDETIKFNHLTNLLENHSYNFQLKNYVSKIKKIYKESFNKISSSTLNREMFKDIIIPCDYSKHLALIESKVGFKHPALKYLAMYEAKIDDDKSIILEKNQIKDRLVLESELNKLTSLNNSRLISESIVKNGINTIKNIKSNIDGIEACKSLLDNTYTVDEKTNNTLQECLFIMSTNPKSFTSKRKKFIETLLKYVR